MQLIPWLSLLALESICEKVDVRNSENSKQTNRWLENQLIFVTRKDGEFPSNIIHVRSIYPHLVNFHGKCSHASMLKLSETDSSPPKMGEIPKGKSSSILG